MVVAGSCLFAPPAAAGCKGRDLFPELREREAEAFERIEQTAQAAPFRLGRLLKISKGAAPPSYLFGTLHLADPRVTAIPEAVRDLVTKASVVAVESKEVTSPDTASADETRASQMAAIAKPGTNAESLLDAKTFATLEALAKVRGLPKNAARTFKPTVLALLLDQPPCAMKAGKNGAYLDALIAKSARTAGIRLVGIETLSEQLMALDGLDDADERDLLLSVIRQADRGTDLIETQILRYHEQDLGALVAWLSSPEPLPGVEGARTPPAFLERLLDRRSLRMKERILPLLEEGNAFIAVGAAHLPGGNGIAAQLAKDGFTVERVEDIDHPSDDMKRPTRGADGPK